MKLGNSLYSKMWIFAASSQHKCN